MMMIDENVARSEFRRAIPILRDHGLKRSARYCAEVLVGLTRTGDGSDEMELSSKSSSSEALSALENIEKQAVSDAFLLASSFFELGEYVRCAVALTGQEESEVLPARVPARDAPSREVFLWAYSLYLAGEKRKEEMIVEAKKDPLARVKALNAYIDPLRDELESRRDSGNLTGLAVYALGMVLKEIAMSRTLGGFEEAVRYLERKEEKETSFEAEARRACDVLAESVRIFPWNWSAWMDIAELNSPSHDYRFEMSDEGSSSSSSEILVRACHSAHLAIEQQRCDEALKILDDLKNVLEHSTFVVAHQALAHYARRDFEAAQERFETLRAADPYRLDQLDIYSNVLYVKESRADLSRLAHSAMRTEKFRPETCCVVGNYYSLKRMHERAVLYFQRALRLDRNCLSAWTLMGHEYIEMKNTNAAIEAYRRAVDVNARDYRAWYGLGQTYEILNMYFYALYYYRKAARLRPYDARMWIAIAQCHEKLNKIDEAIKYYERAAANDDEAHATLRLAKLHRQRNDVEKTTFCYQRYVDSLPDDAEIIEPTAEALLYLATRLKQQHQFQPAQAHLARLLDYAGPEKLEAQAMLREIRALADSATRRP